MVKCMVPIESKLSEDGKSMCYVRCGEQVKYKVGMWLVCEGHKKYYTDVHKWPAKLLKGENING